MWWNSNWNLPLAIGSVVKCAAQRIKSQLKAKLFASSPVAIAAALSLLYARLSVRLSVGMSMLSVESVGPWVHLVCAALSARAPARVHESVGQRF